MRLLIPSKDKQPYKEDFDDLMKEIEKKTVVREYQIKEDGLTAGNV